MCEEHHATRFEDKMTVAEDPEPQIEVRTYRKDGIVLIPKPSDDPKDPLVRCRTPNRAGQLQPRSRVQLTDNTMLRSL